MFENNTTRVKQSKRKEIKQRDDYTCYLCGTRSDQLTIDHVIPSSRGGSNEDSNLKSCCVSCNCAKSDMTILEFAIFSLYKANNALSKIQLNIFDVTVRN
jgi:5-methylcytosine-specific restriction endonuclease McrA